MLNRTLPESARSADGRWQAHWKAVWPYTQDTDWCGSSNGGAMLSPRGIILMEGQASLRLDTEQSERPVERLLPAPPSDSLSTVWL
jgi:hypothetical protein